MNHSFFIYLVTNTHNTVFYTGMTNDLPKRIWQHKNKLVDGFTKQYNLVKLVHYEMYDDPIVAITREKQLKRWKRPWKIALIEKNNPDFKDLYNSLL